MPRPLSKRQKLAPGQERSLTVVLKSLRNPPLDVKLSSLPPNTSILYLKEQVSEKESIPVDKLRVLHKKKPVPDSKVLKDLVGEDESEVEFSVMVMGGASSVVKKGDTEAVDAPVAQGASGAEVLQGDEFWDDLKGFLVQRLRDEEQGEKMYGIFRNAWDRK